MVSRSNYPRQLVVDGEEWQLSLREEGGFRFTWVSGIVGGSGFIYQPSRSDFEPSTEMIEEAIRNYMSEVDPETGYLD
jgi:hypothetical protein